MGRNGIEKDIPPHLYLVCVCVWSQIRVKVWTAASRSVSWRQVDGRCADAVRSTAARIMNRCAAPTDRRTSTSVICAARRVQNGPTSSSSDAVAALTVTAALCSAIQSVNHSQCLQCKFGHVVWSPCYSNGGRDITRYGVSEKSKQVK